MLLPPLASDPSNLLPHMAGGLIFWKHYSQCFILICRLKFKLLNLVTHLNTAPIYLSNFLFQQNKCIFVIYLLTVFSSQRIPSLITSFSIYMNHQKERAYRFNNFHVSTSTKIDIWNLLYQNCQVRGTEGWTTVGRILQIAPKEKKEDTSQGLDGTSQ